MSLTLTAPGALWLMAATLVVWIGRRYARTNFNPRQRLLQTVLRSALVIVLALAIARPVASLTSSQESIVFAVDISASISSHAIAEAARRIDEITAAVHPSHSRIVAFGTRATTVESTAALGQLGARDVQPGQPDVVDRTGTDLEGALEAARSELGPGYVPRIVLFSDGRATAGDVRAATARLAAAGIPVSVEPMATRDLGDTWVDEIAVPKRSAPGALVSAAVMVGSQRATQALVELREGAQVLGSRVVALAAGETPVPFDVAFDEPGSHVIEATVTAPGDPLVVNNQLRREIVVGPRPRVLYIESTPESAHYLAGALTGSGFDVTTHGPDALPSTADGFDPWDAVILSDLPRATISDATMSALSTWVERRGGGLLVAGGDAVFGEGGSGGYHKTELERLTPVTFERKDEPEVALIIVLDKSWSMAGQQIELCKTAAQAAVDVMSDEQMVGVVTFNDELNWDVTLRNVGKNRAMIKKAISAIEPSGHTLIYPAIEQAYLALKNARARAKHVVLLSDGRSYPDDYEGLVKKMVAEKMTVSSIAVGPAADRELLGNIADWGHGRSYVVEDAREVPQIFVKEAKSATNPSIEEKPLKPVLKTRAFLEGVDLATAPSLHGRTATVIKDGAVELVETPDHDPLLAFWPIGLGRSAVFASDVKDRWASEWIKWRGYGPFFASVVRAIARDRGTGTTLDVAAGPIRSGTRAIAMTIEARDASGAYRNLLKPVIHAESPRGLATDVPAHQTAPGQYQASVVVDASDPVTLSIVGAGGTASTRVVLPDVNEEYRWRLPDDAGLKAIADATGGVWTPTSDALRNTGAHQAARRALWPALVLLALGLWLLDVWLRRVRLFERAAADVSRAVRRSA